MPIKEIIKLQIETERPLNRIDNLRKLRHNINYYGYKSNLLEVQDALSLANLTYKNLSESIKEKINKSSL